MSRHKGTLAELEAELRAFGDAVVADPHGHLDGEIVERFRSGELTAEQRARVAEHLDICRACATLAQVAHDLDSELPDELSSLGYRRYVRASWRYLATAAAIVAAFLLGQLGQRQELRQAAVRSVDVFEAVRAPRVSILLPRTAEHLLLVIPVPDERSYDVTLVAVDGRTRAYRDVRPVDGELTIALPADAVPAELTLSVTASDGGEALTLRVSVVREE